MNTSNKPGLSIRAGSMNPSIKEVIATSAISRGFRLTDTLDENLKVIVAIGGVSGLPNKAAVFVLENDVKVYTPSEWLRSDVRARDFNPSQAGLCEDEGCDHHGTPHICIPALPGSDSELMREMVENARHHIRHNDDPAYVRDANRKDTNPKDAVGVRKWRQFVTVPMTVVAEIGVAMMEGARKYGRHNYRVAGVRASVYVDAAIGHIAQWWEGEDVDKESGLSHVTKAIASLVVLRDAMIQNMLTDDRPPRAELDQFRTDMQRAVDDLFERHPDSLPPFTQK